MSEDAGDWYATASDEDCVYGLADSAAIAEADACHYAHSAAARARKDANEAKAEILRRLATLRAENARLRTHPVVWADDATPFDGPQVAALLAENARLRECVAAADAMARALLDKSGGAHECNGGPDRCWYCADNESDRAVVATYDIARAALADWSEP